MLTRQNENRSWWVRVGLLLAAALSACGGDGDELTVTLTPATGQRATGTAVFQPRGSEVVVEISVENAPPGQHGVAIHAGATCGPLGVEAGAHWNPTAMPHGGGAAAQRHAGDIGNVLVGPDGKGRLLAPYGTSAWSIGTGDRNTDIRGKTVVLHDRADDFVTQPNGNSGDPIACGPIPAAAPK